MRRRLISKAILAAVAALSVAMVCSFASPQPQPPDYDVFLGEWKGIITQDLGPTVRYFDMDMNVAPVADEDGGYRVSCHVADGDYHAYMSGTARVLPNGELFVQEHELVRADSIPGMAWCLKRLELRKSMERGVLHLRGRWTGDTYFGACPPGDMDLIRGVVRT